MNNQDYTQKVCIVKMRESQYPTFEDVYRPEETYPESPFPEHSGKTNEVYAAVRRSFQMMGFDAEHFGANDWNPLGDLIKPGNTVLLKPNLVMHANGIPSEGNQCLYTQPSVVAAVMDYVIIALKGRGRIVIGDAPMQECDFERLAQESGYEGLVEFYRDKGVNVELVDFRELKSVVVNGVHHARINKNAKGRIIDLGEDSEFSKCDPEIIERMRITNYDPAIMPQHHNIDKHEYYISEYILDADVIINMPKPKSHRKAGVTISLKNMVGANVRKEFLPHHTLGAVLDGGDEYDRKSIVHRVRSHLYDMRNHWQAVQRYSLARATTVMIRCCSMLLKVFGHQYAEGSWYGNRTISKTIADINKIVCYADKNGNMQPDMQRKMLIVADMVISGEKEGPVYPTAKLVGMIAVGCNSVCFDEVIATIMGFDIKKIPAIREARYTNAKYPLIKEDVVGRVISNIPEFDGKEYSMIPKVATLAFEPTSGWKGHIEL